MTLARHVAVVGLLHHQLLQGRPRPPPLQRRALQSWSHQTPVRHGRLLILRTSSKMTRLLKVDLPQQQKVDCV
jgi:hypothetical protein